MKLKLLLLSFSLFFMTGCVSTNKMALQEGVDAAIQSKTPVYLMTVSLKNEYRISYQPTLLNISIESNNNESNKTIRFAPDKTATKVYEDESDGSSYYLSMAIEPGDYTIRGLSSNASGFLINGSFFTPIHQKLTSEGSGIFYLGHINAVVKERVGSEFKAGASIPLLDQAAIGASGGTFDVTISDQWEEDKVIFFAKYPSLKNVDVNKKVLAPFNKEKAQTWWEDH